MRTIDMSENNHGSCTGNHSVYLSEVRVRNDKKCKQNRPDRDAGPELIFEDTINAANSIIIDHTIHR